MQHAAFLALAMAGACVAADSHPKAFPLPAQDGVALIEWISASTFRFCRAWETAPCKPGADREVEVEREDAGARLRFRTKYLHVDVDKATLRVSVRTPEGPKLLEDLAEVRRAEGAVVIERSAPAGERFYGLGAHSHESADLRGTAMDTTKPFLMSSRGYGLHHASPGRYTFDLARKQSDRYRITVRGARKIDYYFHFGPSPKEILEEHKEVAGTPDILKEWQLGIIAQTQLPAYATPLPATLDASWESLCDSVRMMAHASLSGIPLPAFDIGPYQSNSLALYRRALQLAQVAPVVFTSSTAPADAEMLVMDERAAQARRRWLPFFLTYADEARLRGLPMLHSLPLQFPRDHEASKRADEFLMGDEMLAAPVCTEDGRRSVYLPMGVWTNWRTNKVYPGRQTIEIEAAEDELPLFVKNGAIVPAGPRSGPAPMELHYFPKLASEFFLFEPEVSDYTQAHANPALDLWRLEMAPKVDRTYEWVLHNLPAPGRVWEGETVYRRVQDRHSLAPGCWYIDEASSNIHVAVRTLKGKTNIVHLGQ